jgi:hypothetical protein
MPRIQDKLIHSVAFLYPTRADAENNTRRGGTCFLVGKEAIDVPHPDGGHCWLIYAVTNFHVAWTAGSPIIRLNRRDGRLHIIELTSQDWIPHPGGDDLAMTFLSGRIGGLDSLDRAMDHVTFVETPRLLTEDAMRRCALGLGDEVFMIGRFLNHQGTKDKISPAIRFGSISVMPESIPNVSTNADQISFAVEMRSRTGFSGSVVAAYRSPLNNIFNVKADENSFLYVIGVNWGYIVEKDTRENTWLNGVVPAWKILELMEVPALRDKHDKATDELKKWQDNLNDATAVPAVASDDGHAPSDANPSHREDFEEMLGKAVKLPK